MRKHRFLLIEALLNEVKSSLTLSSSFLRSRSFTVTSDSPPQTLALVHVPDATCIVLSFAVHPVLMDLPAGSCLEFFRDERCTDRLFGYFGDKNGLHYLPPLVIPGDRCYDRMSQGTYARYKFLVDAFSADFGLALWLCEEIYQKLLYVHLSHYEVETVLTTALDALADYLVLTCDCMPFNGKSAIHQITGKLINFAMSKGVMHSVPISKLSGLAKELICRFSVLVHLALEECGEADDQNVYSAAAVTRCGIISNVLYLPVDNEGQTKGYAFIDIGRADVIANLLARISEDAFEFDGGTPSEEKSKLLADIEAVCRPFAGSSNKANNVSLNKLLISTLPLVNLRPWTDPSSLRSRIVSIRQLIFPGVKIRFFAQTQDNTAIAHSAFVDATAKRPVVTIDRRKIVSKRRSTNSSSDEAAALVTALHDPKRSLFASTMNQLSTISPSLLRAKRPTGASDPFVSFVVIFASENVVGEGVPYRQLFNNISNELLADGNPLFIPTQNNVMKTGGYRERFMPKPSSTSRGCCKCLSLSEV
ncbi:unnamed protein product [Peronospora belbahrii]|uniref:Uncharacterized protein n=1 Tax=Peronospora belbahrii TaxID=622444 RepID=A0ABN8D1C3_9STRA|nr:unnamed protein product [Peronospora belbahrii]